MNISFSKLWILVVQKVGRIVNDPHFFNKSRFFGKRAEQNFAELVEDSNINFPQFFLKLLILPQFVLAFIVVFYLVQSLCKNVKF